MANILVGGFDKRMKVAVVPDTIVDYPVLGDFDMQDLWRLSSLCIKVGWMLRLISWLLLDAEQR